MAKKKPILDDATEETNEKREKAKRVAKELQSHDEFQRGLELEVVAEDDQELKVMVEEELKVLDAAAKEAAANKPPEEEPPVMFVNSMADIEKLPPQAKAAMKSFVEQCGGMPPGGLIQVKMEDVETLDKAVDSLLQNSNINLSSIVCSRLAAERANKVASAIVWLFNHATELLEKPKQTADDKEVIKKINNAIQTTFKDANHKVAHALAKELGAFQVVPTPEPDKQAASKKEKKAPKETK